MVLFRSTVPRPPLPWPHRLLGARRQRTAVSNAPGALNDTQSTDQGQLPRFYVPARLHGQPSGWMVQLDAGESKHTRTLRLQQGSRLELCDGQGSVVLAEIASLGRDGAVVRTLRDAQQVPLRGWQWQVAAACGSLKGGRADWLVEKCVELGAAEFIPIVTQRSPVIGSGGGSGGSGAGSGGNSSGGGGSKPGKKRRSSSGAGGSSSSSRGELGEVEGVWGEDGTPEGGREGRWHRLAAAALKQSMRAHSMRVQPPCDVQGLCSRVREADVALAGVAGAPPLHEVAAAVQQREREAPAAAAAARAQLGDKGLGPDQHQAGSVDAVAAEHKQQQQQQLGGRQQSSNDLRYGLLVVGPEGDFTADELEQLLAAGALPVGLGDLRLRAETAAIALLSYMRLHFAER